MSKLGSKAKILLFVSGAILVGSLGYVIITTQRKSNDETPKEPRLEEKEPGNDTINPPKAKRSIFPQILQKEIEYTKKYDQSGNVILDQAFASRLFRHILYRVDSFKGEILFDYTINQSKKTITLYFKLMDGQILVEAKSYEIPF